MGFPAWREVCDWLNKDILAPEPEEASVSVSAVKNLEIPRLVNYNECPDNSFWEKFPKRDLPLVAETTVNVNAFEEEIELVKNFMTSTELRRAGKVIEDLRQGAEAFQKTELPPVNTVNAKSALENGEVLTDTIATWIKKGFVAGPFDSPPLPGFRVNPLGAVVRNGKVRPILNMSGPKNKSFNDNVDRDKLERLHMGTAKQFGTALRAAGKDAVFSKFDIQDAYKLIPAKTEDYRLQGFSWLGKYFVETRMSFGGVPSPCNFDRLGKTKDLIVCIKSSTPRSSVFRALDDSPCVGPKDSHIPKGFSEEMREFCNKTSIPLAPNCPKADKAFESVTKGTVLGVGFNSSTMNWFLSKEKAEKVMRRCWLTIRSSHASLEQLQQLMGSINDLAQMSPLLKFHKRSGNALLRKFSGNSNIVLMVTEELRNDLAVIAKVASSSINGLPIAYCPKHPTLAALSCYTDAAGASFTMINGKRIYHGNSGRGVSCLMAESEDDIWAWTRVSWPDHFLTEEKDEKGVFYGSKSTTLESVGLLLPMIAFPDEVAGRNIVFSIDNIAVMHGWLSGYVRNDRTASEVLKAAQYMAAFLGVTIYVKHVPRVSNPLAHMADEISRKEVDFSRNTAKLLSGAAFKKIEGCLIDWLDSPNTGCLAEVMIKEMGEKLPNYIFAE